MNDKKIAVVTGSSRGIGKGIAEALGKNGFFPVLSGTAPASDRTGLVDEFAAMGIQSAYIKCDIALKADRENLIDEVFSRYGKIDLLVNNAGVAPEVRADVLDMSEESLDRLLNINLKGNFFMTQYAAKKMLAHKKIAPDFIPRMVMVTSISAYTSSSNRAEYCVSKAGLSMATQIFAERLADEGVFVFEVRPGIIQTDMTAAAQRKYETLIADGLTPVKRMGTPGDVAGCVLALARGYFDFAPGQIIDADGGFHIRRL